MSRPFDPDAPDRRRQFVQLLVGLLALPLSLLPFLAYGFFTTEGRLLRDRLIVAVSPPHLTELTAEQHLAAVDGAPWYQGKVMALVYHGVGSTSDAEGGFVVSPSRFGEHLATLRAAGMATVTAADVARAFTGGAPLPDRAVMITFDDGRADAMMFADPLLEQAEMKATMFLISSATDRPNLYYAGWDRIEKAARSGRWDIQAHTHDSHREQTTGDSRLPLLTSLTPGETLTQYQARIEEDLDRNNTAIQDHVGSRPVAFAYPFGAYGGDRTNDPRIRDILRQEISRRYPVAFQQDEQESVPLLDPAQDRTALRRLEVGDWSGADLLGRIVQAAGGRPASVLGATETTPELLARGDSRPPSTQPGRVVSVRPPAPPSTTSTVTTGPPPTTTEPATETTEPPTETTEPPTTTTTEPPTTTTTEPPTTTTTEPPTTTTTQPPPTTTTTAPSTTTTTRPSSTTTTTEPKPCRGNGGKPCRD